MLSNLIFLLAGFVAGLIYSRGRANPLRSAWIDFKLIMRGCRRCVGNILGQHQR
jgi:hypothetical protein